MKKKQYIVALGLAVTFSTTGYAANPALKEYVDTQVTILQSQIAAIPAGEQGPVGADGVQGPQGPAGAIGPQGDSGPGVASGGTTGQILAKASDNDYDTQWGNPLGPQYTFGQRAEGGIVFFVYMDSSNVQHILIAAETDEPGVYNWEAAVSQCDNKTTAGYTDWFLPNKAQLSALFNNRYAVSPTTSPGFNNPANNGGFQYTYYWCSSEGGDITTACNQDFFTGSQNNGSKVISLNVRCVRAV